MIVISGAAGSETLILRTCLTHFRSWNLLRRAGVPKLVRKEIKKKHGLKKFDPITQAKLLVYGRIQNAIVLGVDLWSKRFKQFEVSQVRFLLLGILPCTFFIFVWKAVYGRNKTFSVFLELLRYYRKPSWGKGHSQTY